MKRMMTTALLPLAALTAGTNFAAAQDEPTDQAEIQAFQSAEMTLSDAVSKTEEQNGGQAMSAEWTEEQNGAAGYEVEIADASGGTYMLFVNAKDGSVAAAVEMQDDQGTSEDGEGEDDDD